MNYEMELAHEKWKARKEPEKKAEKKAESYF